MKERQVQIPVSLFTELCMYFDNSPYADATRIRKALLDKLDAIVLHDTYTTSKTALTEKEREAARQKYLDDKGIHPDWRG